MPNYFGRAVFVGNLPIDIRERELEDLFSKYGRIVGVDIKTPSRPPAFAFVEFEDPRDAEDAARGRDGVDFLGSRIRVEVARGANKQDNPRRPVNAKSAGYRVLVKGLPPTASWQDLKDHFRKHVRPLFTDVQRDRDGATGVAEFETYDEMKQAIRKLDDTEFKNSFEKGGCIIRVFEDSGRGGRDDRGGGGRDHDRRRDDDDHGRGRGRDDSRRRSRSPRRMASRSRSPPRVANGSRSPPRVASRSRSPHKVANRSRSPPLRRDSRDASHARSPSTRPSSGRRRSPSSEGRRSPPPDDLESPRRADTE